MTDLLNYPVLALSPSGVDIYQSEGELVTCHRRTVRSTYRDLRLLDMDGDMVHVQKYRVNPLPPRVDDNGLLNSNHVRLDLVLSPPKRLDLGEAKKTLESSLLLSGGADDETLEQIRMARDLEAIVEQLKLTNE